MESSVSIDAPITASVRVGPADSRCRWWAKIVRAGTALPMPSEVSGASDVPGPYLRQGEDELMPDDIIIEGEERDYRKNRGWYYRIGWAGNDGKVVWVAPDSEAKAKLKAAGLPIHLLPGSGEVAACVRIGHGRRLGLI